MSLSNLYFRGCFEQPSDDQKEAIEEAGGIGDVVDKSCSTGDTNSCGKSIEQLFDEYPLYDPKKGVYRSWGDVEFPWEISSSTPNLLLSETDDMGGVAQYTAIIAYEKDSMVLLIEDNGYTISLHKAKNDIPTIPGAFDSSKWNRICYVETTKPAGVLSVEELLALYEFYELKLYDTEWGRYDGTWDQGTLSRWDSARIRRDFFYRAGDIVLVGGQCEDVICVYIAKQDIPATDEAFEAQAVFNPRDPLWQRIYCVPTSRNKCLEYQRRKEPELGYDVVEIGSKGHFVEMPVPYRLRPNAPTLDEVVELRVPPRVLTQDEIDALNQPQEEE